MATEVSVVEYDGDGANDVFPTGFKFLEASHLVVTLTLTSGTVQVQTQATHYTVDGEGDEGGGDVTFVTPPPSGSTVEIKRNVPVVQLQAFTTQSSYSALLHENAFDYLTFCAQQLSRRVGLLESGQVVAAYDAVLVTTTFLTDANVEDTFPVSVALGAGVSAAGVRLVRVENLTDTAAVMYSPPGIDWAPASDAVSLRYVSGLEPANQYRLTLEVLT